MEPGTHLWCRLRPAEAALEALASVRADFELTLTRESYAA